MSLRKSPQLTHVLLAAARHNAKHSTRPRNPAAKQNSKLNPLKHEDDGARTQTVEEALGRRHFAREFARCGSAARHKNERTTGESY
jgi:hypothetical protein